MMRRWISTAFKTWLSRHSTSNSTRLRSLFTRFSAPVYPGENLRFEFPESDTGLRFKAIAEERDVVVLDRCHATLHP